MGKSIPITINNIRFESQKALNSYCKEILHRYPLDTPVNKEHLEFLKSLLERHPEKEKKKGVGVKNIIIQRPPKHSNTKCFMIVRLDNSTTDFSYSTCIKNDLENEPKRMFNAAARSVIANQKTSYLNSYKRKNIDPAGTIPCELSKKRFPTEHAVVHHAPPYTFEIIVKEFIEINKLDLNEIEYNGFKDMEVEKTFKDDELATKFSIYHKQHAHLQVVEKELHSKLKKKGNPIQLKFQF